jgi:ABC-2 type transport system ATP-binding protein
VIVLDEPTAGVDPQSRNAIFDNLEALRSRGKALVYTTHYMEEAERLCDRILIMDHGRIVANGTLAELRTLAPAPAPKPVLGPTLEDVFLHLTGRQLRD